MRDSIFKTKFIFLFITVAVFAGAALLLSFQAKSDDHADDNSMEDMSFADTTGAITVNQTAKSRSDPKALSQNQSRSEKLVGTWNKEKIDAIEPIWRSLGGNEWRLTVIFTNDGRFVWDSRRPGTEGGVVSDSLTGKYTIEQGFMIVYHFDEPSAEAFQRLPELFAFWPNELLGRHTFRFEDDYLILGFDGGKIWFYLKKRDIESD